MDGQEQQIEEIFSYYGSLKDKKDQEILVEFLREIQEVCGCIPPDLRQRAADMMQVKESVLTCLIRRYPSLKEAPYQHTVTVCTGERCGKKAAADVLGAVRRELKVDTQGLSADKKVLLKTRNCLKQCRTAPNLMIDGVLYPQVTPEKVSKLIKDM